MNARDHIHRAEGKAVSNDRAGYHQVRHVGDGACGLLTQWVTRTGRPIRVTALRRVWADR